MNKTIKYITTVDDDPIFTDMIEDILMQSNAEYKIDKINSGPEFMKRLENKHEPMDIAVIDIHMPGFNIIECVMKMQIHFRQTYIIVVSGDFNPKLITNLFNDHHIWGYVLKDAREDYNFTDVLMRLVTEAEAKIQFLNSYSLQD